MNKESNQFAVWTGLINCLNYSLTRVKRIEGIGSLLQVSATKQVNHVVVDANCVSIPKMPD